MTANPERFATFSFPNTAMPYAKSPVTEMLEFVTRRNAPSVILREVSTNTPKHDFPG